MKREQEFSRRKKDKSNVMGNRDNYNQGEDNNYNAAFGLQYPKLKEVTKNANSRAEAEPIKANSQ